eukprot:c26714_g1_i1 orf=121-1626(+)
MLMDLVTQICSLMGLFTLFNSFVPSQLREQFDRVCERWWDWIFSTSNPYTYLDVPEDHGDGGFKVNYLYKEVELYISSLQEALATQRVNVHRSETDSHLSFSLAANEMVEDTFRGSPMWWTHNSQKGQSNENEKNSFSLKMLKADRKELLCDYLDYISKRSQQIERLNTQRHLNTNNGCGWEEVPFNHPSTFDTLALEPELKDRIKADLEAFRQGQEYYHSVGRAWKRGYLLYGPPGTGKSSMIAAIANFLNYDIYDVELTKVYDNSELRSLLIHTSKKSVIVIEDIDCSIDLSNRSAINRKPIDSIEKDEYPRGEGTDSNRVTLSGLLNFSDGLWSCCGEERIIIFTTNHKDRLDPALLRAGRMDFHILLSYCTFPVFKILASNYLSIQDHELYPAVERGLQVGVGITPAQIAEVLIAHKDNPEAAMKAVMAALHYQPSNAEKEEEGEKAGAKTEQKQAEEEEKVGGGVEGRLRRGGWCSRPPQRGRGGRGFRSLRKVSF